MPSRIGLGVLGTRLFRQQPEQRDLVLKSEGVNYVRLDVGRDLSESFCTFPLTLYHSSEKSY